MKSVLVIMTTVLGTFPAFAQSELRAHTAGTESLRHVRQMLEKETESKLLEQLEEQRLEDEKRLRARFENLNFSVVQAPAQ